MSNNTDNERTIIDTSPRSDYATQFDGQNSDSDKNWLWNADQNSDLYNWGITSEYLKETTSIRGWLAFFLVAVALGGTVSAVSSFMSFNLDDYDGMWAWGFIDIFIGLACLFTAGYTIYSFIQRKPNAVFVAKVYVAVIFFSNLLSFLMGGMEGTEAGSWANPIRGLIWGAVWFTYLCVSKQVKEVCPKIFRKRKAFDIVLLVSIIVVPIVLFIIGCVQLVSQNLDEDGYGTSAITESTTIYPWEIGEDEYTDGISVFKAPDGFECDSQSVPVNGDGDQEITIFTLESDEAQITYVSDYETDMSKSNFVSYWTNWKDNDLNDWDEEILIDELRTINGNPYHYRLAKYTNDTQQIAWRYILVYDRDQSKVSVISAYDVEPEKEYGPYSYLKEFISSIRFE